MKFRALTVAAATAASLAAGTLPAAEAEFAGAFTGTAMLGCFGCGPRPFGDGMFTGEFTGTIGGNPVVQASMTAKFGYNEDPANCATQGSAEGEVSIGTANGTFIWTRVGVTALITVETSAGNGAAVAAFAVTSPIGSPCGQPVTALVVGAGAGV